jgi:hypothetical protein
MRLEASVDRLRLELFRLRRDDQNLGVELRLIDAAGMTIMAFKLPANVTQAITGEEADWQLTMSPDGCLAVYVDGSKSPNRQIKIGLSELVQQSLSSDMLEDEPELRAQLTELKRKLAESITLVDRILTDLDKPTP